MPEFTDISDVKSIRQEMDLKPRWRDIPEEEVRKVVENYDKKFVGSGGECVVFLDRDESKKGSFFGLGKKPFKEKVVVAVDYRNILDPIKAKEIFYSHRLMATLFPLNFPRFATSFGSDKKGYGVSGTIRQRIDVVDKDESDIRRLNKKSSHPFNEVSQVIRMLHLPVNIDHAAFNFGADSKGDVYYLDRVRLKNSDYWPKEDTYWHRDEIENYMNNKNYSESDKRVVMLSIDRLNSLKEEKGASVSPSE